MAESDESQIIWPYNPSFALAVLATILYGLSFLWIAWLTLIKYRSWYFSCVVVGALLEVVGYALRIYSTRAQTEIGPFVATLSLIVLAPVFVAAGNYLLIGRLIRAVLPANSQRVFGIHGRLLTRIFVLCDVISFLVQCAGSAVASSEDWQGPTGETGVHILIGGLAFQVLTFCSFMVIFARFHVLALQRSVVDAPVGWRKVVTAVYLSSTMILLRSIYRVIEFPQGIDGYPFTHEWLFWVFEAAPMLIAITIFCLYHPSKILGQDGGRQYILKDDSATEMATHP